MAAPRHWLARHAPAGEIPADAWPLLVKGSGSPPHVILVAFTEDDEAVLQRPRGGDRMIHMELGPEPIDSLLARIRGAEYILIGAGAGPSADAGYDYLETFRS